MVYVTAYHNTNMHHACTFAHMSSKIVAVLNISSAINWCRLGNWCFTKLLALVYLLVSY